ncbi:DUF4247 domain-containing protein [Aquibacillus sediminis]|uniref:DUF4247 domain-containing protein n=1 Tax=Aquibacillus sediminis TaxID=2574734 RepID=UPI001108B0A1|nr:DUF4247 domain-containing protein [Aquibacillus sediminis]
MWKKYLFAFTILLILLLLSACGTEQPSVSVDDIPDEPSKQELMEQIEQTNATSIKSIIADNFFLLDTVEGSNNDKADVYATRAFSVSELVDLVANKRTPEEKSDLKDNQQILIYPNHFVTFKQSEEDATVTLIEVASNSFVRNNYSPNFLSTYFAIRLLDNVLGVNNWANKRRNSCQSGDCYGGYTVPKSNNSGSSLKRGLSTFRGGGPSVGK